MYYYVFHYNKSHDTLAKKTYVSVDGDYKLYTDISKGKHALSLSDSELVLRYVTEFSDPREDPNFPLVRRGNVLYFPDV